VLNAGNRRGSKVVRGTQDGAPITFETFCPKVLAGINTGKLPDTISDRAINVPLERRKRGEGVERFKVRDIAGRVEDLRTLLEDWAAADHEALASYRCEPIPEISERLEEGWESLLAVAELAGGEWPRRARKAAVALAQNGADIGGEDQGELLLRAVREIFGDREVMFTGAICEALNGDDELPFGGYRKGEGIDGRGLSSKLKPYGIKPQTIEYDGKNAKGYRREWFLEVWARYAPDAESARAQDAADDPSGSVSRQGGSENSSVEPKTDLTDREFHPSGHPSGLDPAFQSQNGGDPDGLTDLTHEVQPSVPGCSPDVGLWTPEAGDTFVARARELFPGSTEVSSWVPRPGSGIEPTPAQCADPAERVRLWWEHGVKWVCTPPSTVTEAVNDFDLQTWYAEHPEIENQLRCQGVKANGERCTYQRHAGSRFCGVQA